MENERERAMNVRELQHLAAAMAHEVRNPLNSMAIHLELIEGRLRKSQLPQAERDALIKSAHVVAAEIERIDRTIEEYLRFAGPEEAARQPVEATALVAGAIERAHALSEDRGVGLEVRSGADPGRWAVDAEALSEALDALIANAIQASQRGSVVEIAARSVDEHAELVVRDLGDGIAQEDIAKVFQLGFSRRERPGLGLTVAKQIVKGHGGSITAQSPGPGAGATFTVRMPLDVDPVARCLG